MQEQEQAPSRLRNLAARRRKAGTMQSSPQSAPTCLSSAAAAETQTRKREDLAYQAVTVAAILLILCSVWVF
jgi:hypothetical protein